MKNTMMRLFIFLMVFTMSAFAEDKGGKDQLKKEMPPLESAVEEAVNSAAAGMGVLQHAKATYLENYGLLVTVETALLPPRNPFAATETSAQVRSTVTQRRTQLDQKIENLLKQQIANLKSVGPEESLTVVLYLINSNPADFPDLPSQIVMTVKKADPSHVNVREF